MLCHSLLTGQGHRGCPTAHSWSGATKGRSNWEECGGGSETNHWAIRDIIGDEEGDGVGDVRAKRAKLHSQAGTGRRGYSTLPIIKPGDRLLRIAPSSRFVYGIYFPCGDTCAADRFSCRNLCHFPGWDGGRAEGISTE